MPPRIRERVVVQRHAPMQDQTHTTISPWLNRPKYKARLDYLIRSVRDCGEDHWYCEVTSKVFRATKLFSEAESFRCRASGLLVDV